MGRMGWTGLLTLTKLETSLAMQVHSEYILDEGHTHINIAPNIARLV